MLDQWSVGPGDQLPQFMESLREHDFVLIICTPRYKQKSDGRIGGVGYEGHIMTAELMTVHNNRKFIPILRHSSWQEAAPSWLSGKYYVDLSVPERFERNYEDLLSTLHGARLQRPLIGSVGRLTQGKRQRAIPLAVFLAALLITLVVVFRTQWKGMPSPSLDVETEADKLNRSSEPVPVNQPSEINFTLYPNMVRGDGERSTLRTTPNTQIIRLHLLLLADKYQSYQVELMTEDGRTIKFISNLQSSINDNEKTVIVRLPAWGLAYGDYSLELSGMPGDGTTKRLARYFFRIAR